MAKGKWVVALPDGTRATRRSDRPYTFAIIGRFNVERRYREDHSPETRARDLASYEHSRSMADGTSELYKKFATPPEQKKHEMREAKKYLAGRSFEQYYADLLNERDARLVGADKWRVLRWSQKETSVRSALAQFDREGWYTDLAIVEVARG